MIVVSVLHMTGVYLTKGGRSWIASIVVNERCAIQDGGIHDFETYEWRGHRFRRLGMRWQNHYATAVKFYHLCAHSDRTIVRIHPSQRHWQSARS